MRKLLCMLLCALLLLPAPGAAEDTATIDSAELMARQTSGNTALRAAAAMAVNGPAPFFLTEEQWATLSAVTPGLTVEGTYTLSRFTDSFGDSMLRVYLKRDGETLSTLRLNGRGDSFLLWGDALGDTLLSLPRDTEALLRGKYLTLSGWQGVLCRDAGLLWNLLGGDRDWPGLFRAAAEVFSAEDSWRAEVDAAMEKYLAHLSSWLQEQSSIRVERDDAGGLRSVVTLKADRAACAGEAVALLELFARDTALQELLRQHMTAEEAAAYLEPGMTRLFASVLRALPNGEGIYLERVYAAGGEMERLTLTLALTDELSLTLRQEGDSWVLSLPFLTLTGSGDSRHGWQGRFSLAYDDALYNGSYQLFAAMDKTYTDASSGTRQRRQDGMLTLIVTPDEGEDFPAQLLTATLSARAGETNKDAASWRLELDWQETGGGAQIRLMLQAATGDLLRQTEAEGEPLALAELNEDVRAALWDAAVAHFLRVLGIAGE